MDLTLIIGIIGSLTLVAGSALVDPTDIQHPRKSIKNWLFAIGGVIMLAYAILGYVSGGTILFVLLELLVVIASILMMLNTDDKIDTLIIGISALLLILYSLYIAIGYQTIIFILVS